jgi:hypothetical protein
MDEFSCNYSYLATIYSYYLVIISKYNSNFILESVCIYVHGHFLLIIHRYIKWK